jgi:hypothetical protein
VNEVSWAVKTNVLIALTLIWESVQVLVFVASAPPLSQAGLPLGAVHLSSLTFFTYQSLLYHSLALPLLAVLVYLTLQIFGSGGLSAGYAKYSITLGYAFVSAGSIAQVLTRWNPVARDIFLSGLALSFTAGVALLFAFNPFKVGKSQESSSRRGNLPRRGIWIAVLFVLVAAVVGAYASTGSSQWGASATLQKFTLVKSTHEHVVITVIDVAIVALAAEHFGIRELKGVRGLFADIGMYSMMVGTPVVAIATFATVPFGVEAHNVITPFSAVLLQGALFVMYAIMADFTLKRGSGNKLRKLLSDPLSFGLLFMFLWVDVAVGLPGIYVAVNLRRFAGSMNEVPFMLGHEHALITLTAMALLLMSASVMGIGGIARKAIGLTVTGGYMVATGASVLYIFLDPNPEGSFAMPYIQAGIILMLVGVFMTIVAMIGSLRKGTGGSLRGG